MIRRTEYEIGEDANADVGTRTIFGMTGDVADDEDETQDSE
jgi:hypothetical protein